MTDPMLLAPDPAEFRFALYCRAHLLDLTWKPDQPVALYRDEATANAHGARMWPSTFIVVDLAGEDRP
ncbi:hypothetical protein D3C77_318640 [compost metagenome]